MTPMSISLEARPCTRCQGTGRSTLRGAHACWCCQGRGTFAPVDVQAVRLAIAGRKTGLRSAKPKDDTENGRRAAYVWRWARFHGGADVTMPCTVSADGDPWKKELDDLADVISKEVFGTDMAATYRWGSALGLIKAGCVPQGLPPSSYQGGKVNDGRDKETTWI